MPLVLSNSLFFCQKTFFFYIKEILCRPYNVFKKDLKKIFTWKHEKNWPQTLLIIDPTFFSVLPTGPKSAQCFVHPIFCFLFLVIFFDEVMKLWKYYVIFVYILQGNRGKMEKKRKENHATKVTKIPKMAPCTTSI